MLATIKVKEGVRERPIRDLGLPVRVQNLLQSAGWRTLGDLHGVELDILRGLSGAGVETINTVLEGLERIQEETAVATAAEAAPEWTTEFRVERVPGPSAVSRMIGDTGVATLFDLHGLTDTDPSRHKGVGKSTMEGLKYYVARLVELGPEALREITGPDDTLPALDADILAAVAGAESLHAEVEALCYDLSERNQELFLRRSGISGFVPTLEELGAEHGVSRERVRQIVRKHERMLEDAGLQLPIASTIAALPDAAGGIASTGKMIRLAAERGVAVQRGELQAVPHLAELGLCPRLTYVPEYETWLSVAGTREWQDSGLLKEAAGRVRKRALRCFRRMSCVPMEVVQSEPLLDEEQVFAAIHRNGAELKKVAGFVVPLPAVESRLTRLVKKTLSVSPRLNLDNLKRGLRRDRRLESVPPTIVLEAILSHHPDFAVDRGGVQLEHQVERASVLSDSEQVFVQLLEEHGGAMEYWEIVDAVEERGFSRPMVAVLLRRPFVRRSGTGIYALRGHAVAPELIRQKNEMRLQAKSTNKVSAGWLDPLTYEVTYRLSRYNLDGVLPLPSSFNSAVEKWEGILPDGRRVELTLRHHLLWSLGGWFEREDVQEGDYVIASFYPGDQAVEIEHIPGGHAHDE